MIKLLLSRNKSKGENKQIQEEIFRSTLDYSGESYVFLNVKDESFIKKINNKLFLLKPDPRKCFLIFNKGYEQKKAPLSSSVVYGNTWQVSVSKNSLIEIYFPIQLEITEQPTGYVRLYGDDMYCSTKMLIAQSVILYKSCQLHLLMYTTGPTFISSSDFIAVLEVPERVNIIINKQKDTEQVL